MDVHIYRPDEEVKEFLQLKSYSDIEHEQFTSDRDNFNNCNYQFLFFAIVCFSFSKSFFFSFSKIDHSCVLYFVQHLCNNFNFLNIYFVCQRNRECFIKPFLIMVNIQFSIVMHSCNSSRVFIM